MKNTKDRIDRLLKQARTLTWKPDTVLLTGQEGNYTLEIREWDGVPGSARIDPHSKKYSFERKEDAKSFVSDMCLYWNDRYGINWKTDIHFFDVSIPTDAELKEFHRKEKTVLEFMAERDGMTLEDKLREVYGQDVDLTPWSDIIRWNQEDLERNENHE